MRGEVARDELALELKAEDDVEVVRDLVRVDADQGRLNPVDAAVELLLVDAAERGRERLLKAGIEVAPERAAPAD